MVQIPTGNPGVAAFESDNFTNGTLLAGNTPEWADEVLTVAAATGDLALYSVVGLNATGEVVLAEAVGGTGAPVRAIGFTAAAFVTAGGLRKVKVCRQANVFVDALIWPASYDTDAKRIAAFAGAPSPTAIVASKHPYAAAI